MSSLRAFLTACLIAFFSDSSICNVLQTIGEIPVVEDTQLLAFLSEKYENSKFRHFIALITRSYPGGTRNTHKMLKSLALVTCLFASVAAKSILDILAENSKLSTLHAAVSASKDVSELLSSPGHLTLFAPSNDAFLSYPMADYKVKYLLDPVHQKNLATLLSVSTSKYSFANKDFAF